MGLPAVYGFARQSRGTATVASQPGLGTHVKIIIPQAQGPVAQAPKTIRHIRKGWGRILLVDDEPDLLEVMAEVLGELGYTVSTAGSGDEALARLATRRFDILLSDVAMRRMNGIELARHVQAQYPGMKILLMSGFAAEAMPTETPWRVLEKPLTDEDLAAALASLTLSGEERDPGQGGRRDPR